MLQVSGSFDSRKQLINLHALSRFGILKSNSGKVQNFQIYWEILA